MRKIELVEAKQKLSELVKQAARGERIGITRRGKFTAVIGPVVATVDLQQIFRGIEAIRKRARKKRRASVKRLVVDGASNR